MNILLSGVIVTSLTHCIRHHALLATARSILAVEVKDRKTAALLGRDSIWRAGEILGTTYVGPALTVLNVKLAGEWRVRHVVLVTDNIDREHFRRIRVLLRWADAPATGTATATAP